VKPLFRWLLLCPSSAAGFAAVLLLYWPARLVLLHGCPVSSRIAIATTDFSKPNYQSVAVQSCSASWYPAADASLFALTLLVSVLVAGAIAYWFAPTHRRMSGLFASILAIVAIGLIFLFWK
jgi:hypothetical protein